MTNLKWYFCLFVSNGVSFLGPNILTGLNIARSCQHFPVYLRQQFSLIIVLSEQTEKLKEN